jgi:hypothetical protein
LRSSVKGECKEKAKFTCGNSCRQLHWYFFHNYPTLLYL